MLIQVGELVVGLGPQPTQRFLDAAALAGEQISGLFWIQGVFLDPNRAVRAARIDLVQMAESPILDRIDGLVDEEHRLWAESERGQLDEAGHMRLEAIRGELDRCWDLLRRRRANPDAPENPPLVPDPPNDLEGPEAEPPHLEHGVHGEGPAPDPGVPRDIP